MRCQATGPPSALPRQEAPILTVQQFEALNTRRSAQPPLGLRQGALGACLRVLGQVDTKWVLVVLENQAGRPTLAIIDQHAAGTLSMQAFVCLVARACPSTLIASAPWCRRAGEVGGAGSGAARWQGSEFVCAHLSRRRGFDALAGMAVVPLRVSPPRGSVVY